MLNKTQLKINLQIFLTMVMNYWYTGPTVWVSSEDGERAIPRNVVVLKKKTMTMYKVQKLYTSNTTENI
jgi:hypothetical protein